MKKTPKRPKDQNEIARRKSERKRLERIRRRESARFRPLPLALLTGVVGW